MRHQKWIHEDTNFSRYLKVFCWSFCHSVTLSFLYVCFRFDFGSWVLFKQQDNSYKACFTTVLASSLTSVAEGDALGWSHHNCSQNSGQWNCWSQGQDFVDCFFGSIPVHLLSAVMEAMCFSLSVLSITCSLLLNYLKLSFICYSIKITNGRK